jgi:hypothetical protein
MAIAKMDKDSRKRLKALERRRKRELNLPKAECCRIGGCIHDREGSVLYIGPGLPTNREFKSALRKDPALRQFTKEVTEATEEFQRKLRERFEEADGKRISDE